MIYLIDLEHLFRPPSLLCSIIPFCVVPITLSSEVQDTFLMIRLERPSREYNPAFFRISSAQRAKKNTLSIGL